MLAQGCILSIKSIFFAYYCKDCMMCCVLMFTRHMTSQVTAGKAERNIITVKLSKINEQIQIISQNDDNLNIDRRIYSGRD